MTVSKRSNECEWLSLDEAIERDRDFQESRDVFLPYSNLTDAELSKYNVTRKEFRILFPSAA